MYHGGTQSKINQYQKYLTQKVGTKIPNPFDKGNLSTKLQVMMPMNSRTKFETSIDMYTDLIEVYMTMLTMIEKPNKSNKSKQTSKNSQDNGTEKSADHK